MRRKTDQGVVLNLKGPGSRPKALEEAFRAYDDVCMQAAACMGERREARAAIPDAKYQDIVAHAEALTTDTDAPATHEREEAARAKVTELEARQAALDLNADAAGNRLVAAIVADQAEWLATLRAEEEKAATELRALLDAARPAVAALAAARIGADWVEDFNPAEARLGQLRMYQPGKSLRIDKRTARRQISSNDDYLDAVTLLELLEDAVDPPASRKSRSGSTERERRFVNA